jgi:hypothetical protein
MITDYRFGQITIDGKTYDADVIVYADRVDDHWWRKEGHRLSLADLEDVIQARPDTLVVGTGYFGRMTLDPDLREALAKKGIRLVADVTRKAAEEFNRLRDTGKVVATLHLTC